MARQEMVHTITRYYKLQPGDMTCYRFMITWMNEGVRPVTGLDEGYVVLTILMEYTCNVSYVSRKYSLRQLIPQHVAYLRGQVRDNSSDLYTTIAVCKAAALLVDDPENFAEACAAMLETPDFMREYKAMFELDATIRQFAQDEGSMRKYRAKFSQIMKDNIALPDFDKKDG